jgi:hypothetical protein
VFCPSCKSSNPDDNRFCGKCGTALASASSSDAAPRVDELSPELIEFDRQIPLIAEPGSDRRNRVPDRIREQAREIVERDRIRQAEAEAKRSPQAMSLKNESQAVRPPASFLGLNASSEEVRDAATSAETRSSTNGAPVGSKKLRGTEPPLNEWAVVDPVQTDGVPVEPVRGAAVIKEPVPRKSGGNSFLNLDYVPELDTPSTGVSGPSFLGLSDEYELDEEQQESHTRRNVALLVLLVLIGLGATQWSQIRDTTLPFVKNGTQEVMVRVRGKIIPAPGTTASKPSPVNGVSDANATSSSTTNEASNGSASNGEPNMEVAPTNDNAKKPAADSGPTDSANNGAGANGSSETSTTASTPNPATGPATTAGAAGTAVASGTSTGTGGTPNGASNNAGVAKEDTSKSTAHPDSAKDSADESGDEVKSEPAKKSATTEARKRKPSAAERPQITEEESQAGRAELMQANAATDPTLQNALLWRAVKKGNPDASVKLAENYIYGRGVEKSCEQAMMLLRSASAHTNARARGKLGAMYATGECVQQDRVQAYHWMSMALQANPSSEWTAQYRDRLWSQMSPGEQMRAGRDR